MNDWFRLHDKGDGSDDNLYRPDFYGHEINSWSGNKTHPQGSPQWIVRVYAEEEILDALESESGVVRYDNVPDNALNNMLNAQKSSEEWEEAFKTKGGNND